MEHKFEEPIKTKEALLEEFINKMSALGYISDLTGQILTDPILIEGSSSPVERQFIKEAVRTTGKNPFNRKHMTVAEINNIVSNQATIDAIEKEIQDFLEANKNHPEYKDIEQAVNEERYVLTPSAIPSQANQPTAPTPDDVLAMQQAVGMQAFQAQQPQAPQFFQAPQQAAPRSQWVSRHFDNWTLNHDLGGMKHYLNNNPVNVLEIMISDYNHERCEILISAGYRESPNALSTGSENNRQLLEALQNHGITADLNGGGTLVVFPSAELDYLNMFNLETSAEELVQVLLQILDALQDIEPSIVAIRDDVMNTFPERSPGPEITG